MYLTCQVKNERSRKQQQQQQQQECNNDNNQILVPVFVDAIEIHAT